VLEPRARGLLRPGRRLSPWPVALALGIGALAPAPSAAQAWSSEKGSVGVTFSYSNNWNTKHYFFDGSEIDAGHTRSQVVTLGASLALTDRWALSASLPYVQARYRGAHAHPGTIDDGEYHGTIQNLGWELRYQTLELPLAITPFVSAGWPTHEYATLGHAAPGQGVDEYALGAYLGWNLDPWISRTFLQLRYGYTFAEKVAGISHDRSNADLEVGFFATRELGLRALVSWQDTHGGVTLPIGPADPRFPFHDAAAAADILNLGVGLSYSLGGGFDLFGIYVRSVAGRNAHKLDDAWSVGVSFGCLCASRRTAEPRSRKNSKTR